MNHQCDICGAEFSGRSFKRRSFADKKFCSISCVEAFEVRSGLPNGRIYETRPGWSSFPVSMLASATLPC